MYWRQKHKVNVHPLEAENLSWPICEVPRTRIIRALSSRQKKYESALENPAHPGRDLKTFMSLSHPINKWGRFLIVRLKVEKLHPLAQSFHSPSVKRYQTCKNVRNSQDVSSMKGSYQRKTKMIYFLKIAECQRIDALKLWSWRRLLRAPSNVRTSKQPNLKEINPEYSLAGLMLKLQYFGHLMERTDSLEKTLMLGKIKGKRRRGR